MVTQWQWQPEWQWQWHQPGRGMLLWYCSCPGSRPLSRKALKLRSSDAKAPRASGCGTSLHTKSIESAKHLTGVAVQADFEYEVAMPEAGKRAKLRRNVSRR